MNKIDSIIRILESDWSTEDLVQAWNEFCDRRGYSDNEIYYMGSFNEMFENSTPMEIAEMVLNRDFRTDDDYFAFNAYGNVISFSDVTDYNSFSFTELAEYLVDWGDSGVRGIDNEELLDDFVEEYYSHRNVDEMKAFIYNIMEEESFDLLMDDWNDLYESVEEALGNL